MNVKTKLNLHHFNSSLRRFPCRSRF